MSINLTDRQIELFRQLMARKDELCGHPFSIAAQGDDLGFGIVQLSDSPVFEWVDFYDYVKSGLLIEIGQGAFILTAFGESTAAPDFQETGGLMTDLQTILLKLNEKRAQLRKREAEYGGNVPPEWLDESDDHQVTIDLIKQLIEATAELRQELGRLNISADLKAHLGSILGEK